MVHRYLNEENEDPICEAKIFSEKSLLDAVQMSGIFPDSKTFVDKKLRFPPERIIKKFESMTNGGKTLSMEELKKFLEENFDKEGLEIEEVTPEDWTVNPAFINQFKNAQLRGLALRINSLWKDLSRKIVDDVKIRPNLYSMIYVPNTFVVPGGRFREFYYWDTYWIIKALLLCDMTLTVRGMIENFFVMITKYGCIPNGGRIYYSKRSQPPYLTLMVKEYYDKTKDVEFIRHSIPYLVKEMTFWEQNRVESIQHQGETYTMFRFGTGGSGPRPESYREDYELAQEAETAEEKQRIYYNLKAGAETGWDYSSRWMINKEGESSDYLKDIYTDSILPVDLNCLIYMDYVIISDMFDMIGDAKSSKQFKLKASKLRTAVYHVLYDENEKMWFDFDIINSKPRKYFYMSNIFPLWAKCFPEGVSSETIGKDTVEYLKKEGALQFKGGVPTSLTPSGQQWDYPNAWPPLQHILVVGLLNCGQTKLAQTLARLYTVGTMFSCSDDSCHMYEKYDVTQSGSAGGGGEYDVQEGFGWTNGVIIDFMNLFKDDLLVDSSGLEEPKAEVVVKFDVSAGKSHPLKWALQRIKNFHRFKN